jgi:hypothetical protein
MKNLGVKGGRKGKVITRIRTMIFPWKRFEKHYK